MFDYCDNAGITRDGMVRSFNPDNDKPELNKEHKDSIDLNLFHTLYTENNEFLYNTFLGNHHTHFKILTILLENSYIKKLFIN